MVVGFGAILVAHHPKGMMPGEFWGLVRKRSAGEGFPSFMSGRFGSTVAERIDNSIRARKSPSTSIGGTLAGAILASEVVAYLLRETDLVTRETVFAPRFIVVDPMRPIMEWLTLRRMNPSRSPFFSVPGVPHGVPLPYSRRHRGQTYRRL